MDERHLTTMDLGEDVSSVLVEETGRAAFDLERMMAGCSTAAEILSYWARRQRDSLAYAFLKDGDIEEASLTFGALEARARAVAAWLRENGAAGERALLLYSPGLDFLVAFFGCLYAGVIAVPLYPPRPNRRDSRIIDITEDANAAFALTTSDVTATLSRALEHSPELGELLWCATDALPHEADRETIDDVPAARSSDVAYLQYTSGSTRSPRGVMVTHGNVLGQLRDIEVTVRHPRDSVFVTWLPHFHDMGLVYGLLTPLCLGFPCYLMPPAAFLQHPVRWLRAMSRYRATHSGGPNFAFELCARRVTEEQKAELDLGRWKVAFSGAEPVRASTLEAFAAAFGGCGLAKHALSPAYGLAEATLKVTVEAPGREPRYLCLRASELARHRVVQAEQGDRDTKTVVGCGGPATIEILIVNPDTLVPCRHDEVGEIWLRGSSIAHGYWQRADETRATFQASPAGDGRKCYMRTGDLGFLHDGELFVTGRTKDLIIIRGRNHYPHDIEQTVQKSHPALRADAGAACPVEIDGEERLVVIQEIDRHRHREAEEALSSIRNAIHAEHEVAPYAVVLVRQNSVPTTSSGKIQRRACARSFLEGSLPVVSEWREASIVASDPVEVAPLRSREDIEDFLSQKLSSVLSISRESVDIELPFNSFGLDSLRTMTLLGEIESWLGRPLSPTVFWNYPTIAELATHLAEVAPEPMTAEDGRS